MEDTLVRKLTIASAFIALLVWWFLIFYKEIKDKLSVRKLILTLVVIGLVCRIVYAVFTPDFYAPDEEAHFNYIKYLAVNKSFPVQAHGAIWHGQEYEYYQPPLYYTLSAIVAFPFVKAGIADPTLLLLMRLLNILFWLISFILALHVLRKIKFYNRFIITIVTAFFTMVPTFTSNSATVNNDILPITLGTLFLLVSLKLSSKNRLLWPG